MVASTARMPGLRSAPAQSAARRRGRQARDAEHGGQQGNQGRPDHEDQLLHGRLDRERGLELAAVAEQVRPERPHARPDRWDRRPGEAGQPGQHQR
jgi:hypothetical protein